MDNSRSLLKPGHKTRSSDCSSLSLHRNVWFLVLRNLRGHPAQPPESKPQAMGYLLEFY